MVFKALNRLLDEAELIKVNMINYSEYTENISEDEIEKQSVLELTYDSVLNLGNGVFAVKAEYWHILDNDIQEVSKKKYVDVAYLSDGYFICKTEESVTLCNSDNLKGAVKLNVARKGNTRSVGTSFDYIKVNNKIALLAFNTSLTYHNCVILVIDLEEHKIKDIKDNISYYNINNTRETDCVLAYTVIGEPNTKLITTNGCVYKEIDYVNKLVGELGNYKFSALEKDEHGKKIIRVKNLDTNKTEMFKTEAFYNSKPRQIDIFTGKYL